MISVVRVYVFGNATIYDSSYSVYKHFTFAGVLPPQYCSVSTNPCLYYWWRILHNILIFKRMTKYISKRTKHCARVLYSFNSPLTAAQRSTSERWLAAGLQGGLRACISASFGPFGVRTITCRGGGDEFWDVVKSSTGPRRTRDPRRQPVRTDASPASLVGNRLKRTDGLAGRTYNRQRSLPSWDLLAATDSSERTAAGWRRQR